MKEFEKNEELEKLEYTRPELIQLDMGVEVLHGASGDEGNGDNTPGDIVVL